MSRSLYRFHIMHFAIVFIFLQIGRVATALASSNEKTLEAESVVKIEFSNPEEDRGTKEKDREGEGFYAPPIEFLFRNPAIQANLSAGVDAINSSVDTLMDSIFYSIMNNDTNFHYNDFIWYNLNFRRRLFSTPSGYYVVVDRFQTGPIYNRVIWNYQNIPLTFGVNSAVEAMQIYIRTDGMRIAQDQELSTPRRLLNNWLGLVPALAGILPPSFNQNQLYDPLTEIETPFVIPLSVDKFYSMPIGSIRSYALNGGIRLSPDLGGLVDPATLELLARIGGIQERIPYAIFKRGEHRINVLRHGDHTAWVGVSDLDRMGQAIQPFIGQRYFILHGALAAEAWNHMWMWSGVPLSVLPLNIDMEQSLVKTFDQVYEYDLRNPAAQAAYEAAVTGDFLPSRQRFLDAKEKSLDTGVIFHFSRTQDRYETVGTNGPNVAVFKKQRERVLNSSEIEITDSDGKFHMLESALNVNDKKWNILVGDDETRSQQIVTMKVRRVINKEAKNQTEDFTYAFEPGPDPYRLTMTLSIQDKYVDTDNYNDYVEVLRYVTALPLAGLPHFSRLDAGREADWRRRSYFVAPSNQINIGHVPPTYLGRFGAEIAISLPASQIDRITSASDDAKWEGFASAFEINAKEWSSAAARRSFKFQSQWYKAFFAYPLRLINLRFAEIDAVVEATNAIAALNRLRAVKEPLAKLEQFRSLFDTDHPLQIGRAILNLAELAKVPRKVTLSAQPQGTASAAIKATYGMINGKTYRGGPVFPGLDRYAKARAALAKFYLNQPRESADRPRIQKIQVTSRKIPDSVRTIDHLSEAGSLTKSFDRKSKHAFITFRVDRLSIDGPIKVFVRIDEAGKLQLGKLTLVEKVIELPPIESLSINRDFNSFEFYLTGPLSPLSNEKFDEAVNDGDDLSVTMAVSKDGAIWSDEGTFSFALKGGRLYPVQ
ncbi:MAG: hypothetical protein NTY08_05080 [Proteobacteria bacterium]|nr:hypothetical protein [Pseudomonadota bacterium]